MDAASTVVSGRGRAGPTDVAAPARWRRVAALTLVILFGVLAPLGLVAGWARATVLDTGRYVDTVAPLAEKPEIRGLVKTVVTRIVVAEVRTLNLGRAAAAIERQIVDAVDAAVESDGFRVAWREGNRLAHRQVVALLTGEEAAGVDAEGGQVTVDLGGLYPEVQRRLADIGITVDLTTAPARVTIFASDDLVDIQRVVEVFDRVGWGVPVAAVAVAVLALVVAPARWRTLRRAGIALVAGMVVVAIVLLAGRALYLDALDGSLPRDAAAAVFDVLVRSLWVSAAALFGAGVAAIVVGIAGERRGRGA